MNSLFANRYKIVKEKVTIRLYIKWGLIIYYRDSIERLNLSYICIISCRFPNIESLEHTDHWWHLWLVLGSSLGYGKENMMPIFSPASHSTTFHQLSSYSSRYPLVELKCFCRCSYTSNSNCGSGRSQPSHCCLRLIFWLCTSGRCYQAKGN